MNRDKTWATLKSLQVFMPASPPTCEGYAFSADGSPTVPIAPPQAISRLPPPAPSTLPSALRLNPTQVPIAAPQTVVFDDLQASPGSPMAAPKEEWCYRDTSVKWNPAPAGVPRCSFESCFDLDRCRPPPGEGAASPLPIFIDTPVPTTPEMARWPACMRRTMGRALVGESRSACLVVRTLRRAHRPIACS